MANRLTATGTQPHELSPPDAVGKRIVAFATKLERDQPLLLVGVGLLAGYLVARWMGSVNRGPR